MNDETMFFKAPKEENLQTKQILQEVYQALTEKGYPKDLCAEIAYKYLNTDYTATRMLGYLYRMTEPPAVEVVVDEMIAILSDRDQLIKKRESEHAQAVISEMYREGL